MKQKISFVLLIGIFISIASPSVYAQSKTFSKKTLYPLYKERVKNFCKEYKETDATSEIIYVIDENDSYVNLDGQKSSPQDLDKAIKEYRKNMDGIYTCGYNVAFKRTLQMIREDLLPKNPKLNAKLRPKIQQKEQEIKQKVAKLEGECKLEGESKNSIVKKSVLNQSTYEMCRYIYYLEYLHEIFSKTENLDLEESENGVSITEINEKNANIQARISDEREKAYRGQEFVYTQYTEFENQITNHILTEVLNETFMMFRKWLHKTINPINQVVYKIWNSMRK